MTAVQGCGEWIPGEPRHMGGKRKGVHPAWKVYIGYASFVLSRCDCGENLVGIIIIIILKNV